MLATVCFDNKRMTVFYEVHNVAPHRNLLTEMKTRAVELAKGAPKRDLCRSFGATHVSGTCAHGFGYNRMRDTS